MMGLEREEVEKSRRAEMMEPIKTLKPRDHQVDWAIRGTPSSNDENSWTAYACDHRGLDHPTTALRPLCYNVAS